MQRNFISSFRCLHFIVNKTRPFCHDAFMPYFICHLIPGSSFNSSTPNTTKSRSRDSTFFQSSFYVPFQSPIKLSTEKHETGDILVYGELKAKKIILKLNCIICNTRFFLVCVSLSFAAFFHYLFVFFIFFFYKQNETTNSTVFLIF